MHSTVLLIGGTGFAGSHMQRLLAHEYRVVVTGHSIDIRNSGQILDLVKSSFPDFVVNFASVTTVKESFDDPYQTYQVGFLGTLNLLEALKKIKFRGRMLNISSSEVYGFPSRDELPVRETAPVRPMNPYSVSKASTEALCYQWSQLEQFEIVTARPFTHIGPGQSAKFAISSFTKQIAEILLKKREPVMHVGDLQTTRDLTDVRDVVRAYRLLMEKGRSGEVYNVCSNNEVSIRSVLNELIGLANTPISISQEEARLRKAEQQRTLGSFEKIREQTGWLPVIPLTQTLRDMLSYWREQLVQTGH
jgi:GDP-4-dehydro-6-deoxy-D-mannose reductase